MYRPTKVKTYDPSNPEYSLIDLMVSESFESVSPEIFMWSLNTTATTQKMDPLGKLYGETASSSKAVYTGPFQIYAKVDFNPIIKEITRLGTETKEEIEIFSNIASIMQQSKVLPKSGDILRVSYILNPMQTDSKRVTFYSISNVVPADLYNNKYVNLQISAEQTNLSDIPNEIKNYIY